MMKLVRFCATGSEKPDLVDDSGALRDFSSYVADIAGATLSSAGLAALAALDPSSPPCVAAPTNSSASG
jgi:ureidoglycolate lyase